MLEARSLSFGYHQHPLLKNIELTVSPHQCIHINGPNGAGKSTLLKILVGLIQPHEGEIQWQGVNIETCLTAYHHQLLYLGHQNGLNDALTVDENLKLDWHWHLDSQPEYDRGIKLLHLERSLQIQVAHLSKGQQRKAGLLRLWMTQACLWILDEPFAALDEEAIQQVLTQIETHVDRGGMVILTSHQPVKLKKGSQRVFHL